VCRCQMVDIGNAKVPMCKGDDALGPSCDDYNVCSVDDKCIPVTNPSPIFGNVACRGVASGLTCEDYNECTDEDICIDIPSRDRVFGRSIICRGEVAVGRACNDEQECTVDDVCIKFDDGFASCQGTSAC
jgi:hypothetical protein